MSISVLEKYLPPDTLPFLRKWFGDFFIHIKITRDRKSKLGDYRRLEDHSHEITVNSTLPPELFFFVLTHELAHLIAFEKYGRKISSHGTEWKQTFRQMLIDSIQIYTRDLRPIILKFSNSPKANFMASPEIVRYFYKPEKEDGDMVFVEDLNIGEKFIYNSKEYYINQKTKKNYICSNLENGKKYIFKPLAKVRKL